DRGIYDRRLLPGALAPDAKDLARSASEAVRAELAGEGDVVAILRVHAGDARVFSVARAVLGGPVLRNPCVLRRPDDDAAGVVAGQSRTRADAAGEHQGQDAEQNFSDHRNIPGAIIDSITLRLADD